MTQWSSPPPRPPGDAPAWAFKVIQDVVNWVLALRKRPVRMPSYTVANLPSASEYYSSTSSEACSHMIYVSNESGGAVPAFTDGTNWRRVTDRVIVS